MRSKVSLCIIGTRSIVFSSHRASTRTTSEIEPYYRGVIGQIEEAIRRERIVSLPARPLVMRLASPAESAAQPAPHYMSPRLIGNTGEQGQFVHSPGQRAGRWRREHGVHDFTYKAAAWTLSAHEGRPGRDLKFRRWSRTACRLPGASSPSTA